MCPDNLTPPQHPEGVWCCHASLGTGPHLTDKEGSSADTCPSALRGLWAIEIKEGLATTSCSEARVVLRHTRMLPRHLQDVQADGIIMSCKPCRQALQHHATVHHHSADHSRARWAEATTQQDGAMLGYDPIGRSYATDHTSRGKTDRTGRATRRPHHHYPVLTFNALASV
jgi:hypothetical protein